MIPLALLLPFAASFGAETKTPNCPEGETIQWIADYCMAKIGTDDEIAASDCIAEQNKIEFRSACAAKLHFKRELCGVLVSAHTRPGTIDACVADSGFKGQTVRNGGVGGQ